MTFRSIEQSKNLNLRGGSCLHYRGYFHCPDDGHDATDDLRIAA
jgi:hypothetical protein